jgi:hypothetical protein
MLTAQFSKVLLVTLFVGTVLLLPGCGGCTPNTLPAELGPLLPVEGKVYVGDELLQGGFVVFYPEDFTEKVGATRGNIDGNGHYTLLTYHPYRDTGAPAGKYRVTVEGSSNKESQDGLVQGMYKNRDKTPLVVTVRAEAPPGSYDLKLELAKNRKDRSKKGEPKKEEPKDEK